MAKTKTKSTKSMFNKIMPSNLINKNKEANQAPTAEIEPSLHSNLKYLKTKRKCYC